MADCGPVVIWSKVPVGSTFELAAEGDEDVFDIEARVTLNGKKKPALTHDEIVAGTAAIEIDDTDQRWIVRPELVLSADADEPIVMTARVIDEDGEVVDVPDGLGGMRPAECEWKIRKVSDSPLNVRISIRSVTT